MSKRRLPTRASAKPSYPTLVEGHRLLLGLGAAALLGTSGCGRSELYEPEPLPEPQTQLQLPQAVHPAGPDAGQPGPDASHPGPDAARPGPDAAEPGPDASEFLMGDVAAPDLDGGLR